MFLLLEIHVLFFNLFFFPTCVQLSVPLYLISRLSPSQRFTLLWVKEGRESTVPHFQPSLPSQSVSTFVGCLKFCLPVKAMSKFVEQWESFFFAVVSMWSVKWNKQKNTFCLWVGFEPFPSLSFFASCFLLVTITRTLLNVFALLLLGDFTGWMAHFVLSASELYSSCISPWPVFVFLN